MARFYNQIAGTDLKRLAALSDGVFAFAMTLLVLDIRLPALNPDGSKILNEHELWVALVPLLSGLVPYLMSFMTLGIFWIGQQTQLTAFSRTDRDLTWLNIAFLCAVSLVPLTTKFLDAFIWSRIALVAYWLNILLLGVMLYLTLEYAKRNACIKEDHAHFYAPSKRRIVTAQLLYAFGALLCVFTTWWSIGFILGTQLIYAIAPRIGFLRKM